MTLLRVWSSLTLFISSAKSAKFRDNMINYQLHSLCLCLVCVCVCACACVRVCVCARVTLVSVCLMNKPDCLNMHGNKKVHWAPGFRE